MQPPAAAAAADEPRGKFEGMIRRRGRLFVSFPPTNLFVLIFGFFFFYFDNFLFFFARTKRRRDRFRRTINQSTLSHAIAATRRTAARVWLPIGRRIERPARKID